jgi:hypothetical protein
MNTITKSWNNETKSLELVKDTYKFINTKQIIDQFAAQGWNVHSAQEARVRSENRVGHQKHMLRFRNEQYPVISGLSKDNTSMPELILQNAHDATSSFRLHFGAFRMACMNGLVVGASLAHFRIVHSARAASQIDQAIASMTLNIPTMIEKTAILGKIELTDAQVKEFASRAAALRLENTLNVVDVDLNSVTAPRRWADAGKDAYTILNRVQESVIRGGIYYRQENPLTGALEWKRTRTTSSVSQNLKLNRQVWDLAEEIAG